MIERLDHGVYCIDTGYQRSGIAACYLVVDAGEAALVETGTTPSAPRILRALAQAGVAPGAVRYLIPTHVHLDHAGGAGALLRQLPNASVLVHPRGLRHLVEPARLVAGALAVYGPQQFGRLYGEVVPVPAERALAAADGSSWELGGRRLCMLDTPGHARHHFCVWDERSDGWFSGDTFGVSYRELSAAAEPFMIPTTTPVQFDPQPLHRSIEQLMARSPARMYLTHYGAVAATAAAARQLHEQIDAYAAMARRLDVAAADAPGRLREQLMDYTLARLGAAGCRWRESPLRRFLAFDMELNAAGLLSWLGGGA